jgi:two-component system chemotaxis response regulator CheY
MVRVLVVEDNSDLRGLIRHRLTRAGHTVEEAATGEGALRLLHEREYDLQTLDIHLPGISGWHLAREIASDPKIAHVPIVVVSIED